MKLVFAGAFLFLFITVSSVYAASTAATYAINQTSMVDYLFSYNMTLLNTVKAFKGIFFGNFSAEQGTQRFNKSMAIQGNFTSNGFHVNTNASSIPCSTSTTVDLFDFGLVVAENVNAINTTVNGAVSYASGENIPNNGCISSNITTAIIVVDFEGLQKQTLNISQHFAQQRPNMVIRDGGFLSDGQFSGSTNQDFYVYTFNKCALAKCVVPNYLYSSPEQIFHGGNWNGPYNAAYPKDKPIIFNIPVPSGTIFNISTANPAAGLQDANILYNVYPVKSTGAYDVNGRIVWVRNTTHSINGFILAPSAYVIENNKGGFTENLIASRYSSVLDLSTIVLNSSTADLDNSTTA